MRRRTLLGGGNIEYVFSAQSTSVSVYYSESSTSVNIKSTANGSNIGYSVVSYDGTVVTDVSTASTYVTIYYSTNTTYDQRNGSVTLKQNDSNKTITINLSQSAHTLELGADGILLDGTIGSSGRICVGSDLSFSNVPSWANVTYLNGCIDVTASSTNSASTARLGTMTVNVGSQSTTLTLIQLPSNYHSRSYVTIGGKNWSIKNVGASSVQDYGNYYQWGAGAVTYNEGGKHYTGSTYTLPSSADTATQVMGSSWRMPTDGEMQALANNSYYWVTYNGMNGGVFDSSGNVLFIPAAGYYNSGTFINEGTNGDVWSANSNDSLKLMADVLGLNRYSGGVGYNYRHYGYSVRGVQA